MAKLSQSRFCWNRSFCLFFSFFSSNHIKDYHESLTGYVSRCFSLSLSLSFCWPCQVSPSLWSILRRSKVIAFLTHWHLTIDKVPFEQLDTLHILKIAQFQSTFALQQKFEIPSIYFVCAARHRFTLNTQLNLVLEHFDLIHTSNLSFVSGHSAGVDAGWSGPGGRH